MAETNCAEILKRWLAAINGHDVSTLTALMAADHVFSHPAPSTGTIAARSPTHWLARRAG
jgi:ketosteroid isomerase-like protein